MNKISFSSRGTRLKETKSRSRLESQIRHLVNVWAMVTSLMVDTWKWKWRESWKLRQCVQNVKVPVWKKWGGRTLDFSNVSSATLRSQYESVRFYTTRCIPKCKYICLYIHLFVKLYNTGHQTGHLSHCAVSIAELILVCGFPSTAGNNKQSPHVVFFTQITKLHCNPPQHVFF